MDGELAGIPWLDRDAIERKAELERRHWWYRGRRRIIGAALSRLRIPSPCESLDVGCGTGAGLEPLSRFGPVTGIDVNPSALALAHRRGVGQIAEGSIEGIPFEDRRFGLITCLDVLEHVENDAAALAETARVAQPGAVCVITVPAYQRLFSGHDISSGHRRRYSLRALRALAEGAGWTPVLQTHFNTLLLPAAMLRRLITRSTTAPRSDLLATPRFLDHALVAPLALESILVRAGISLPAGLSILLGLRRSG